MSDDLTKLSDAVSSVLTTDTDCTCGGCGTGTACATDHTGIKASSGYSVYSYAAPPINDPYTWCPTKPTDTFKPDDDVAMRNTLQDEIIKDLVKRVQRLEETTAELKEENLDLHGSLDALVDIMDAEDAEPHLTWDDLVDRISSQATTDGAHDIVGFINRLLNGTNAKD